MNGLILAVLLQSPAVVVPVDTSTDTREFAAYIKAPMPDLDLDAGDVVLFDLKDNYAVGDVDVTGVAPTFVLGGTGCTGLALTSTDKDNATYGGTAATAAANTRTITIDNANGSAVVDSFGCEVHGSASTDPPLSASDYCLSAAGNDTTGTGHYPNCWKTIGKLAGAGLAAGSDVYFRNSDIWDEQQLNIPISGTGEANRSVFGAFYESGGQAFIGLSDPGNLTPYGTESAGSRPIIQGNYKPACRPNCLWNVAGAIPTSNNSAGVFIGNRSYVTIQDLRVRYFAAQGIGHDPSTSSYSLPFDAHLILQRNYVDHNSGTGILVVDSRNNIIRDGLVRHSNLDWLDNKQADAGAAIAIGRAKNANGLVENMYVHDSFGESIDLIRGDHLIARGNNAANGRRVMLYAVGANDVVIEQNIVVNGEPDNENLCEGTPSEVNPTGRCALPGWSGALYEGTIEEPAQHSFVPSAGRRILFRNNIGINSSSQMSTCLNWGASPSNLGTWWLSGKALGNTCYTLPGKKWFGAIEGGAAGLIEPTEGLEAAGNLFWGGSTTTNCQRPAYPTIVTRYNSHTLVYSDPDCIGTGDVLDPDVDMPAFSFSTASKANFPTPADVTPAVTSDFRNLSTPMTTTYLNEDEWPQKAWFQWEPDCGPGGQLSLGVWTQALGADYCNVIRHATTPDPGAIEF